MIKILIVDDSDTEIAILKSMFNKEKDMEVIACAKNGKEAIEMSLKCKPDLIAMDICMPVLGGIEAIRVILSKQPIPIVVISSNLDDTTLNTTYEALEAGALSVLEKPINIHSEKFKKDKKNIIDTIRSMSEIKVIQRRTFGLKKSNLPLISTHHQKKYELIGIGTSVGGPQALKVILSRLTENFPIPIVIVQHMTPGFISGYAKWLDKYTSLKIKEAENNEILKSSFVYLAPDHFYLEIVRDGIFNYKVKLVKRHLLSGFCPSVDHLLQSITNAVGENSIGILLTGMGSDGAKGLLEIKNKKGLTLIQDADSSVVFGMPKVALSMNAVDKIIKLENISDYLTNLLGASS